MAMVDGDLFIVVHAVGADRPVAVGPVTLAQANDELFIQAALVDESFRAAVGVQLVTQDDAKFIDAGLVDELKRAAVWFGGPGGCECVPGSSISMNVTMAWAPGAVSGNDYFDGTTLYWGGPECSAGWAIEADACAEPWTNGQTKSFCFPYICTWHPVYGGTEWFWLRFQGFSAVDPCPNGTGGIWHELGYSKFYTPYYNAQVWKDYANSAIFTSFYYYRGYVSGAGPGINFPIVYTPTANGTPAKTIRITIEPDNADEVNCHLV